MMSPRICLVCDNLIGDSMGNYSHICITCELALPEAPNSNLAFDRFLRNFDTDNIAITNVYGLFSAQEYTDYLHIIHGLKYYGFLSIGKQFGKKLGEKISTESDINYSAIVPVPLHPAKKRERGFNQSNIIAKTISKQIGVPLINMVRRDIYTQTQTKLSKVERQSNVEDVFKLRSSNFPLRNANILVIDDVLTTGATINATASVLLSAGARQVDCACLAIA